MCKNLSYYLCHVHSALDPPWNPLFFSFATDVLEQFFWHLMGIRISWFFPQVLTEAMLLVDLEQDSVSALFWIVFFFIGYCNLEQHFSYAVGRFCSKFWQLAKRTIFASCTYTPLVTEWCFWDCSMFLSSYMFYYHFYYF